MFTTGFSSLNVTHPTLPYNDAGMLLEISITKLDRQMLALKLFYLKILAIYVQLCTYNAYKTIHLQAAYTSTSSLLRTPQSGSIFSVTRYLFLCSMCDIGCAPFIYMLQMPFIGISER